MGTIKPMSVSFIINRFMLVLSLALLAVIFLSLGSPAQAQAATCASYSNQAQAQRAADTRDTDGDGVYCESLPCPCSKARNSQPKSTSPQPKKYRKAKRIKARIVKAIDGDTIKVRFGGKTVNVRLIGLDTPETHRPGVAVECGGRTASRSMQRLAQRGKKILLTTDPSQDTYDRYGRLLAYAQRKGRDLAKVQISRGYAQVYVYGGNPFKRVKLYRKAARAAKAKHRGVYRSCGGNFHSDS